MSLLAIFLLPAALAFAEPASIELKPPPAAVTIGTPVELEGVARIPADVVLSFEPPAGDTSPVVALSARLGDAAVEGGTKRQPVLLTVAAFELGVVTLGEQTWTLRATDGAPAGALKSPPVRFESVSPPGASGEGVEIKDIRGPLAPPWWLYALPLVLLAAAGYAFWRRRREGPAEGGGAGAPVDTRKPHERALDELRELHEAQVPVKEFYIRLTEILRRYFEARFGVDASVLTTGDLMRHLREAEVDRSVVARCREVFEHADLVKFARWVPATPEIRKDWTESERIVQETAPPEPKPEPPAVPA